MNDGLKRFLLSGWPAAVVLSLAFGGVHLENGGENWVGCLGAAIYLRSMKIGDQCFFYHSNEGLEIVGIMEIVGERKKLLAGLPSSDDSYWYLVEDLQKTYLLHI